MIVVPLAVLLLLEGSLRLFRFGYPTGFFISAGSGMRTTNPKFGWQFHSRQSASTPTPTLLANAKPPGTKRVFVLGESAAAGTPDPAFSFSRMLDQMLQQEFPGQRVEVINAAMRGIDSHIIRQIADECASLSPDLFIVYMGNNDMVGLHSPAPGEVSWLKRPSLIQFEHSVRRLKLSQLVEAAVRRVMPTGKARKQDMEDLRQQCLAFDDPQRDFAYRNYRNNFESIVETANRAGASTIICSVAVNLRDMPPLESLHRRDLSAAQLGEWSQHYEAGVKAEGNRHYEAALKTFRDAAQIDDHHAELLYRIARCEEALGNRNAAQKHYSAARDWDALQFRADSRINSIAREITARGGTSLVRFIDVEKAFAATPQAPNGIPGEALFQEHVHFTFDGDYQLASTLFPEVSTALGLIAKGQPPLTRDECAQRLAYSRIDEANILSAVALMLSKPPFLDQLEHGPRQARLDARVRDALQSITTNDLAQAESIYRVALAQRPDDWMLHYNFARFFTETRRHSAAIPEFQYVVKLFPHDRTFRLSLGVALLQAQRAADAVAELNAALKVDPDFAPARQALASASAQAR